jgi:tetratricopeptide (TPR) repeat protein
MTQKRQTITFVAAVSTMLAAAIALQIARDRVFAYTQSDRQVLYVSNPDVMRRAALSYDALLADVYWIRALQYYGGERQKPPLTRSYDLLYPLLDLTTTLDKRFTIAYRFGAIFLAEPQPGGAGRPEQAIALLKKGIALNPNKWEYYQDIGFIYYWHVRDYQHAAEWFRLGGDVPAAPFWMKTWAAVMLTRGGHRDASRALWTQIGQSEESDWLRNTARMRLAQLDALDQIDILKRVVGDFTRRTGQPAQSWEQLIAAGVIRRVPTDPAGVPYTLDAQTGDIGVAQQSDLWPLPTEPAAAPELKNEPLPVPQ